MPVAALPAFWGAITAGAAAGGTIVGSKIQGNAARDAATLQAQSTDQALADARHQRDIQQGQYANYLQRSAPYISAGTGAVQALAQHSGVSMPAVPLSAAPPQMPTQSGQAVSRYGTAAGTGGLVTVEAPTGERRQVPEAQAAWLVSRGARRM